MQCDLLVRRITLLTEAVAGIAEEPVGTLAVVKQTASRK